MRRLVVIRVVSVLAGQWLPLLMLVVRGVTVPLVRLCIAVCSAAHLLGTRQVLSTLLPHMSGGCLVWLGGWWFVVAVRISYAIGGLCDGMR